MSICIVLVSSRNNAHTSKLNDMIYEIKINKKSNIYPFANEQNIYLYKCWLKDFFRNGKIIF